MIDREVVERKIDIIYEQVAYLDQVESDGKAVFESSFERTQAVKHSLQESIEAALDIGNHILAAGNHPRGENLSDIFLRLAEEGIIAEDLGSRLAEMAKFRNLLVHRYAEIDADRIWTIATEDIDDVTEFVDEVQTFLESGD